MTKEMFAQSLRPQDLASLAEDDSDDLGSTESPLAATI